MTDCLSCATHRDLLLEKKNPYGPEKAQAIKIAYIVAAVVWTLIILLLCLYQTDTLGWIILIIPYIVFFIGYFHSDGMSGEVEDDMFKINYLSLGLIIVLPLMVWINKEYQGDRSKFILIIVVALILNMLSILDIWVSKNWMSLAKHIKSALQTMAIVLLIYALYIYYLGSIGYHRLPLEDEMDNKSKNALMMSGAVGSMA